MKQPDITLDQWLEIAEQVSALPSDRARAVYLALKEALERSTTE